MSRRRAITEADVRDAAQARRSIVVPAGAVVTPAARDLAKQLGVALLEGGTGAGARGSTMRETAGARERGSDTAGEQGSGERKDQSLQALSVPRSPAPPLPVVAIGADHGGYPLKETLKPLLAELGFDVLDLGTHSTDAVDYPDFAVAVARAVADGKAWRGIMVDGAGIGSAMAANKVGGVRAALCYDLTTAQNAREHNDANVLTLGGTLIGTRLAADIVRAFLGTAFAGGRHAPRVEKINRLDGARG